jgi:[CysO sulfur-carrier protein]-S-L-cysteine hydrolase
MQVATELIEQMLAHAREDAPNECCGVVAVDRDADSRGGVAAAVHRAANAAASPLRFEIDARELLDLVSKIESAGHELGAIYHSHTRTAPYPSQTDINFAGLWPGVEWIIVGLANPDSPEVRAYTIDCGQVNEVAI